VHNLSATLTVKADTRRQGARPLTAAEVVDIDDGHRLDLVPGKHLALVGYVAVPARRIVKGKITSPHWLG